MTRKHACLSADQHITIAAALLLLMRTNGVRRVPVVGPRNELIGVLSIDDVLDVVAEELTAISGAILRQAFSMTVLRA